MTSAVLVQVSSDDVANARSIVPAEGASPYGDGIVSSYRFVAGTRSEVAGAGALVREGWPKLQSLSGGGLT